MALIRVIHPLLIFFASNMAFQLSAAYTSRGSLWRYAILLNLAVYAYIYPSNLAAVARTTGWAGRVTAGAVFSNILAFSDRLLLRRWDYDHYGPHSVFKNEEERAKGDLKSDEDGVKFSGSRMDFGSEVTGQVRGIGRFWEVKNVPYFSIVNPRLVPSRVAFVAVQFATVVFCFFIHNTVIEATLKSDSKYTVAEKVPFLTRLPEVSFQELRTRIVVSLGYWIVQFAMIQFFFSAAGLLSALSDSNGIKFWRPLFGSFDDAYNLRNFWGKTWHQLLRSGVEGISDFLAHDVLQLPHKGLLQRYSKILFAFALSGAMHVAADTGGGLSVRESGAMQFFCMQTIGIMVEDGAKALYGRLPKAAPESNRILIGRTIGYTWVLFYLIWTTPVWVFPAVRNMRLDDAVLSFNAVKPILFGR